MPTSYKTGCKTEISSYGTHNTYYKTFVLPKQSGNYTMSTENLQLI